MYDNSSLIQLLLHYVITFWQIVHGNILSKWGLITRGANLRLFCYPGNRFLIRSVNRLTVHNSEIFEKSHTIVIGIPPHNATNSLFFW